MALKFTANHGTTIQKSPLSRDRSKHLLQTQSPLRVCGNDGHPGVRPNARNTKEEVITKEAPWA